MSWSFTFGTQEQAEDICLPMSRGVYAMYEGYYWIKFKGIVQIGYWTNETVEDIDLGLKVSGLWRLLGENTEVCRTEDVKVLSELLVEPVDFPNHGTW